jgi:hypothetical protein
METKLVSCIFCQVALTKKINYGKMYLLYFSLLSDQHVKTVAGLIQAV